MSMSLTPDRKSLRHVGLLGAVPPAIDGLGPVELAGEPGIIINFASEDHAAAPRGGSEAATAFAANDSERHQKEGGGNMPTPEELQQQIGALQQQLEALETENSQLKNKLGESGKDKADAEKKAADTAAEFAAYKSAVEVKDREKRVDALITAGKLEPAKRPRTAKPNRSRRRKSSSATWKPGRPTFASWTFRSMPRFRPTPPRRSRTSTPPN